MSSTQTTQLVLGTIGAVIGAPFGMAGVGWTIGTTLGALANPPQIEGPRLSNLSIPLLEYGWHIKRSYGTRRLEVWRLWTSDLIETAIEQDGKGGGAEVTTYSYKCHMLVMPCEAGPVAVTRVWVNKELVWSVLAEGGAENAAASQATDAFESITFLDGNVDQNPWSVYEADVGVENAIAYIDRCSIGFEGLACPGGVPPLVEVEVVTEGEATASSLTMWTYTTSDLSDRTAAPGSVAYGDAPQQVPLKLPQRFLYDGYAGQSLYETLDDALDAGRGDATGFIVSTGEELISIGAGGVVSIVVIDGSATLTYTIPGLVRIIATNLTETQSYTFTVSYDSPEMDFDIASSALGRVVSLPVAFGLTETSSNLGRLNYGTSDEPFISVVSNDGSTTCAKSLVAGGTAVNYKVGGSANRTRYVKLGSALYIGQTDPGNSITLRKFTVGAADYISESAAFSPVSVFPGLAATEDTVYVLVGSTVTPLNASDLSSAGATFAIPTAGANPQIFCNSSGNLYCYTSSKLYRRDTTWTEIMDVSGSDFDEADMTQTPGYEGNVLYATQTISAASGYQAWIGLQSLELVDPGAVLLNDILTAEAVRTGIASSLLDLDETDGLQVLGYDTVYSCRQAWEHFMASYYFEVVCASKLKTVRRGGDSVVTIAFEDLGVGVDQAKEEGLEMTRGNDIEVAARHALTVYNYDDNHANLTVHDDRLVSESEETKSLSLPIVFKPPQAKGIVNTISADARVAATTFKFCISDYFAELDLSDPMTITDRDGTLYRVRPVRETYADSVREFEAVLDDAAALQESGITFDDYQPSITIPTPATVDFLMLDSALMRDVDNSPGLYASFDIEGGTREARLYVSNDDTQFTSVLTATDDAVMGRAITTLPNWTGGYVWDRYSTVDIELSGGELSSSTETAMQADRTINVMDIGVDGRWERIRFVNAELVDTDTYRLSVLLRGYSGTEYAMVNHQVGDRAVLLGTGLRTVDLSGAEVGTTKYYKAVAVGRRLDTSQSQQVTIQSVRAKPLSSTRLTVDRDSSNNATINWSRRTRLQTRYGGTGGSYLPQDEPLERYEIDIYTLGFTSLVTTLTSVTPSVSYSAASQTADGLTPGDALNIRVYKMSASVGRGFKLESTA